jgi:hypothetical protein
MFSCKRKKEQIVIDAYKKSNLKFKN